MEEQPRPESGSDATVAVASATDDRDAARQILAERAAKIEEMLGSSIAAATGLARKAEGLAPSGSAADASDSDFSTIAPAASSDSESRAPASRVSVLYDAGSMFESAVSAIIECEKAVAALPGDANPEIIARELAECRPHIIVALNAKWSPDIFRAIVAPETPLQHDMRECVVIMLDPEFARAADDASSSPPAPAMPVNTLRVAPKLFARVAPCKSGISAYTVLNHLLRGEFPQAFADDAPASLEEARYFRLALRASTQSTVETRAFIASVVDDWKRAMEPDNLVMFGRFIANVGPSIAKRRIEQNSAVIRLAIDVRVVESPDFGSVVRDISIAGAPAATRIGEMIAPVPACITYSISGDTTTCKLVCRVKAGTFPSTEPELRTTTAPATTAPAEPESRMIDDEEDPARAKIEDVREDEPETSTSAPSEPHREEMTARDVLALISPTAEIAPKIPDESPYESTITCATKDFFALIRASITRPSDDLAPEAKELVAEGERVLGEAVMSRDKLERITKERAAASTS